jgi:hypothetical protein
VLARGAQSARGIDIQPQAPSVMPGDALREDWGSFDMVLGNPPWKRGHSASTETKDASAAITGSRTAEIATAWVVLALESGAPFRFFLPLAALRGKSGDMLARHSQRIGRGYRERSVFTWTWGAHAQAALVEGGPGFAPVVIPPCPATGIALVPGARRTNNDVGMPMVGGRKEHAGPSTKEFVVPAGTHCVLVPRVWPPSGIPIARAFCPDRATVVAGSIPICPEHEERVFNPLLRAWILAHAPQLPSAWLQVSIPMLTGRRR